MITCTSSTCLSMTQVGPVRGACGADSLLALLLDVQAHSLAASPAAMLASIGLAYSTNSKEPKGTGPPTKCKHIDKEASKGTEPTGTNSGDQLTSRRAYREASDGTMDDHDGDPPLRSCAQEAADRG